MALKAVPRGPRSEGQGCARTTAHAADLARPTAGWPRNGFGLSLGDEQPLQNWRGQGLSSVALANPDAVQVYIMMGQSNCVGEGNINGLQEGTLENAVKNKGLYQYLVDGDGNWTSRDDVRNVFIMGSGDTVPGRMQHNEWMTADTTAKPKSSNHNTVGLELGIGHALGEYLDEPVMVLKSCIGNRALGWDLLPPQGEQFEYVDSKNTTWIYAGYGESPADGRRVPPQSQSAGMQASSMMATLETPNTFLTIWIHTTLEQLNTKSVVSFGGKVTETAVMMHWQVAMSTTWSI